jgi:hypothetical protein
MGFYYRKSVNLGPFRVNLSKSGLGYSVGGRGFRVGTTARGKKYTSFSIPGTGVGYRKSGAGCLVLLASIPATIVIKIGRMRGNPLLSHSVLIRKRDIEGGFIYLLVSGQLSYLL